MGQGTYCIVFPLLPLGPCPVQHLKLLLPHWPQLQHRWYIIIMMYSNTSCDAYTQLRVKIVFLRIHRLYMYTKFCSTSCFLSSLDTHTRTRTHTHTHTHAHTHTHTHTAWVPIARPATSSTSTSAAASHNMDWHHGGSRCCKWYPLLVTAFLVRRNWHFVQHENQRQMRQIQCSVTTSRSDVIQEM